MSGTPYRDDQRLALAVARFIEDVHQRCPYARLEPLTPYEEDAPDVGIPETALLSEQALAQDWDQPEEDEAWSHLQSDR